MKDEIDTILILAGGLASRIKNITKTIPKSMIEIAGKPFIVHQLKYIKSQGINNVVICNGYLGKVIENYIGDGKKFKLNVNYSYDGEILLGTGGAIKKALHMLPQEFYVLYGDSFLPIKFESIRKYFKTNKIDNLITVYKNNDQFDKSNIEFSENKILKYDKTNRTIDMKYVDYGLSIFKKSIFLTYEKSGNFDLSELFVSLAKKNKLNGYEIFERFYEVGSYSGIEETKKFLESFDFNE